MQFGAVGPKRGCQEHDSEIHLRNNSNFGHLNDGPNKIANKVGAQAEHYKEVLLPPRIRPDQTRE
tara:strand:- start:602 stop:796 length:195 start_codon:yes stop_codon:yes gene_type:complete